MSFDDVLQAPDIDQGVTLAPVLSDKAERINVSLVGERKRFSLRVRPRHAAALAAAGGFALPLQIGASSRHEGCNILCLGPDEWLMICEPESCGGLPDRFAAQAQQEQGSQPGAQSAPFSLVDISHRNLALRITGSAAAQLLNAGCPLDLSLQAFPVGKCKRTVFEHAQIVLLREGAMCFHVEVWRSFALYLCSYFERVAMQLA